MIEGIAPLIFRSRILALDEETWIWWVSCWTADLPADSFTHATPSSPSSADEDEHDLPSSFCNFFGFGCRGNANTGVFTGTVSDAVTHAPLSGVSVTVNRTDGSGIVSNVTTSSNGTYRTGQLERNVSYNLFFVYTSDDRYLPSTLFRQQLRDIETSLPVVLEIRPEVPNGTLIGTVKNALDAVGIPGARVEIRRGGSNIVGDPLRTATTSPNGTYIFAGLQAGDYTVSANKTGFIPASVNAYVALANQTAPNLFLSPQGTNASQPNATGTLNGTMRVVLSWGALPLDLDVHIRGPVANSTERFHIYYRTLGPDDLIEPPYAHLDHDDRFGNGLETATIARFVPGIYNIYIHNYLGDAPIVGSEARVDLYDGSSHVRTFYPPAAPDARYWLLFTMDGATKAIDADNVLTEVEPTS